MNSDWMLTIDLRRMRKDFFLELTLLDHDRRHRWKVGREILEDIFRRMVFQIGSFFDAQLPSSERSANLQRFQWLADRSFEIEKFLKSTDFTRADTLAISTLITAVPWDLVPFEGECLGQKVSVGLRIPTPRRSDPLRGAHEGRPRFLHVVANPFGDLRYASQELNTLKGMVSAQREIDYEAIVDPTPAELVNVFSAGRRTPFFHFTGHVAPGQGLILQKGILSLEHIARYFPSERDQVVVLNGCDSAYREQDEGGEADLFEAASVANAFLDAGAGAVIAPRSGVEDDKACGAAEQIWTRALAGDDLGAAVCRFRQEMVRRSDTALIGYSYVLYGEPSTRVRPGGVTAAAAGRTPDHMLEGARHEILLEACGDAQGAVEPRHIFAALTRRWIVAYVYFALEGQRYIAALELLRLALRAASPPPAPGSGPVNLSPAGRLVLEIGLERSEGRGLDDVALLEGLAQVMDPEIKCALEGLEHGPRSVEALLRQARDWDARGRQVPAAVVSPDGYVNPRGFLPDVSSRSGAGAPAAGPVDRWDVFAALLLCGGRTARLWTERGLTLPPPGPWSPGRPLHWSAMAASLRQAMLELATMVQDEGSSVAGEGSVIACLTDPDSLGWIQLPENARRWLKKQKVGEKEWLELIEHVHQESLVWI